MICKRCGNETEDEYFLCDECYNKKNDAKTKVKIGIAMSVVGVAISIFSFYSSLSSGEDHYYYFTGLILLGLFLFGSGLSGLHEFREIESGEKAIIDSNKDGIDALFCNIELSQLSKGTGAPWVLFDKANNEINSGKQQEAIDTLMTITEQEGYESRHYLQAWCILRKLGIIPHESINGKVYGVIIEASFNEGTNFIAAYADYSARYFSYIGTTVIWDHPNDTLNEIINTLMLASQKAARQIGSCNEERPMPPVKGITRINILTPSGFRFLEGPFTLLSKDAIGGEIISVGYKLMRKLIEMNKK